MQISTVDPSRRAARFRRLLVASCGALLLMLAAAPLLGASQPVPAEQLRTWAAETDMAPGGGSARRGGRWRVELARAGSQDEALALYDRLREAGYPAEIRPVTREGGYDYVVGIRHLSAEADAAALAARLRDTPGVTEPRVVRG